MILCIIVKLDDDGCDDLMSSRVERRYARKVANELKEPERTIFAYRQNGMTPEEISKEMGIERHSVCRSLAKVYARILTAMEQP